MTGVWCGLDYGITGTPDCRRVICHGEAGGWGARRAGRPCAGSAVLIDKTISRRFNEDLTLAPVRGYAVEYIPIMLAFLAALGAIVGNTWDKTQTGTNKLTSSGRYALALIVFSLIYSVASAYQQRDQKQAEELEKKKLGKIVASEISKSLGDLLSPFVALYRENKGGAYIPGKEITIGMMLDESALEAAQNTCLELRPKTFYTIPDSGTWSDIFRNDISSGITRIDKLVDRYGTKMNSDILDALHDLQANGYFSAYARPRMLRDSSTKSKKGDLPPCVIGQAIGSHKQYLNMLDRIEALNRPDTIVR